jgi:hypothetical protein
MKRKHMPGCYCCQGCYIIPDEELPTITIPGYTFTSWGTVGGEGITGGLCCRCAFFSPNNTEFTEVCSDYFAETQRHEIFEWTAKTMKNPIPKITCSTSGPITTTIEHVCYEWDVDVATHKVETLEAKKWKLFTRYRPGLLRICISKQLVTCDEEEPVEKWVVLSVFQYELFSYMQSEISKSIASESELLHPCFELVNGLDQCDDSCSEQQGDACSDPVSVLTAFSGSVEFVRVKLFDELPEGDVTFDDTAKPENCDWEFCEDPSEFLDQFCVSISSWPTSVYNCRCEETLIDPLICSITYDNTTMGCDCPDFLVIPGHFWEVLFPGPDPCARILECVQPCQNFDCGTFTAYQLCPNTFQPPEAEPCNNLWSQHFSDWIEVQSLCSSYSGPFFQGFAIAFRCFERKACTADDCGSECCYSIECGDCPPCTGPVYGFFGTYDSVDSFSSEWTCELTPTSFCLNAPTWTATFS